VKLKLTADDVRKLDEAAAKIPVQGERYPEQFAKLVDR
jgi:hypothetical protein